MQCPCCGSCKPGTFSLQLKSISLWVPWCGNPCGYVSNIASGGYSPIPASPNPGDPGCDMDNAHICTQTQFTSINYQETLVQTINPFTCAVDSNYGLGGIGEWFLSNPTTVPTQANLWMDTLTARLSILQWGDHLCVYPKIDETSSAAGDCVYGYGNVSPWILNNGPCLPADISSYTQTTYSYSATTMPSWIGGDYMFHVWEGYPGFGTIEAWNGPTFLYNYGLSSNPPGFPDPTYGNPGGPNGGWWLVQVVQITFTGLPFCVAPDTEPYGSAACPGTFPAPRTLTPSSSSGTITIRPTVGTPPLPYYGGSVAFFANLACDASIKCDPTGRGDYVPYPGCCPPT